SGCTRDNLSVHLPSLGSTVHDKERTEEVWTWIPIVLTFGRLFRMYQRVHKRVHRFKKAHKVFYQGSQSETIVGWVTTGFELYATVGPLESKASCIKACNEILKWIKNEESSLFITSAPTW